MGITVEEYFARKKACDHCVEHDNEEHCVTTLLSRAENCLIYNIIQMGIGNYTAEQRKIAREIRDSLAEEKLVDYYVRSENIITGTNLLNKFFLDKYDFLTRVNYLFVEKIIQQIQQHKIHLYKIKIQQIKIQQIKIQQIKIQQIKIHKKKCKNKYKNNYI